MRSDAQDKFVWIHSGAEIVIRARHQGAFAPCRRRRRRDDDQGAEATRNPKITALFVVNEAATKAALVALLRRGIARAQVDPTLDPDLAATWLIALLDGAIGRAVMDPAFDAKAHAPMLRLMIERFLRPPSQP